MAVIVFLIVFIIWSIKSSVDIWKLEKRFKKEEQQAKELDLKALEDIETIEDIEFEGKYRPLIERIKKLRKAKK